MADGTTAPTSRRLLNATAIMASGTLISRVLGFVRAGLLVIVLGATTPQAESFSLATVVPNSLYMLVAGGALNTVLVPQIVRHAKNDDDGGEAFVNRIMTAFLVLLAAVTVLATVLTPAVISLWSNATWREPANAAHWHQLLFMAFLTMPQLFFFGAFFLIGQVLNARDKFGPMMWAPILNNVVGVAVLGLYFAIWGSNANPAEPFTDAQVVLLGLGSTLGILVQTLALIPSMRAAGVRYRPRWDLKGQGLGATFHLAKWMLGYVLLTTGVQIVVTNLATSATGAAQGGAGITVYNTAYLVWMLPSSLLTVSLATAMLPSAARLATAHDMAGVAAETTRTLRLALTFLVPASFAFVALGLPFSRLAFGHGASAGGGSSAIGLTLMALAVGLIPYTIQYVYLRGFYALEDTRSAFFLQLAISLVNIAAGVGLVALFDDPMTVAPRLGLAYALAYTVGAWLTLRALRRKLPGLSGGELMRHAGLLSLAVLPGAVLAGVLTWVTRDAGFGVTLAAFALSAVVAGLVFVLLGRRLGIEEISGMMRVLRRRGGSGAEPEVASEASGDTREDDAPLDYPEVGARPEAAPAVEPGPATAPGQMLDGRFSLGEPLARRGGTVTWRGWDLKLSRPVLLHVMDPDAPRVLEILDQARRAAPAVDSRFLRVWDAVLDEGGGHGSYIVCEYAPGRTLESLLRNGPLDDVEAAWVVREAAAALTTTHAQGVHHQQLNPSTVLITTSGAVKIVGLLIEQALHPRPGMGDPAAADARALGELLYAGLTGRWPGPTRYGLPAAPADAQGRVVPARAVNQQIPVELSDIADRILSLVPRGNATRLESVADIAAALTAVLAGADASSRLEELVQARTQPPGADRDLVHEEQVWDADGVAVDDEITDVIDVRGDAASALAARPDAVPAAPWGSADNADDATEAFWPLRDDDPHPSGPFTPIPPPASSSPSTPDVPDMRVTQQAPTQDPPRRWQAVLLLLFAGVLVVSLIAVFVQQFNRANTAPPAPAAPYALVSARDFDPTRDGGDGRENPDRARYATDGDPGTAWQTERYGRSATFNGRKPGAGVVVDLGEPRSIGSVSVNVGSGPTSAEVRIPRDPAAASAPMDTQGSWRRVGGFQASTGDIQVRMEEPVTARFVLVYLTTLPREGANYVGSVHEIKVNG
ncbi:MAG: murein biosynthesis integral membrane protein MurJ [Propioniciclava sp.]|uniref:murein biosynthesis integral membrane protein MurJ n=1 Tax=Propioniciclava sp. TaxID=2038686 RepID=UPI0039E51983